MSMKILMIALFILLGIMFSLGKWSFLIAGFNYEGQLAATIEISEQPFTV